MPGLRALRWLADLRTWSSWGEPRLSTSWSVGAGPAGVVAALRGGDLGAKTALVSREEFGGMAANDGPVPVRTLARRPLMRESRQLGGTVSP